MAAPMAPPTPGLHVRAGNSMARTRAGLLDGAVSVIEREGLRRLTMSAVATRSGVAKATLYNHFRTKDDVLRELVRREIGLLAEDAARAADLASTAGEPAVAAAAAGLTRAAATMAEHVAGRRVAQEEPGALAGLLAFPDGPSSLLARSRLAALLGVETDAPVVRLAAGWLLGQLFDPQPPGVRQRTARLLAEAAHAQPRAGEPGAAAAEVQTSP